jgi:hypothetical protein
MLSSHLYIELPNNLFPSGLQTKIVARISFVPEEDEMGRACSTNGGEEECI